MDVSNEEFHSIGAIVLEEESPLSHSDETSSTTRLDSELPFYYQSDDALQDLVWHEHVSSRSMILSYWPSKQRGNYVRSYVLSNLRIQAKSTRLPGRWNLGALWDSLPYELIISIFEFLHPIDLYHAIRATKELRRFLLNKKFAPIWRESFLNHPDIPFYPEDVSPPKWASLLFGPATCDICGIDNSLVRYAFRNRRCDYCADHCYDDDEDILAEVLWLIGNFDQLDDVWKMGLKDYRFSSFEYPEEEDYTSDPKYSITQVVEVARKMRKYLLDIKSGVPGAKGKYEAFVNVTEAATLGRIKHAQVCERWAQDIYARSHKIYVDSFPTFNAMVEKVLLRRGHAFVDAQYAQSTFEKTTTNAAFPGVSDLKLNSSKVRKYTQRLDWLANESKNARLIQELAKHSEMRKT